MDSANFIFVVSCERISKRAAYYLRFSYNDQLVERIKNLPSESRKWNADLKVWEVTSASLLAIMKMYRGSTKIRFDFGSNDNRMIFLQQIKKIEAIEDEKKKQIEILNKKKEFWVKYKLELEKTYSQYSEKVHSYLKEGIKLYPHQITAALFMNETRNALISHEMGLGKTASSILYVEMNNFERVIVITPNSLKFNFLQEIEKFTNSKAHIVRWKKNKYKIDEAKYIIINYDFFNPKRSENKKEDRFLKKWKELDIKNIDAVICDESSKLKNTKSNTYKNFKRTFIDNIFKNKKESKIFLSGTPMPNRVHEIYSVLNQISSIDFATKDYFYSYYCGMQYDKENGWGYITNHEESKLEELYYKISPYTHRKRKFEVLTDLPEKIYQNIILEMEDSEYKIYDEIEHSVANEFVEHPTHNVLTIMIRLRQYTASLKNKFILDLIENIIETGEKIVIVDMFKETLYKLYEKLKNISGLHTGDQTVEERAEIVKQFQDPNSSMKIFLGSIQTCNYGLTLTAASKLFIITPPYSVGEYDQVSDRLHRISQLNVVNIYPLIFPDTIDAYVYSAIENKRKDIVKVMDNEDYKSEINESVLSEVIEIIKNKHKKQ